MKLTGFLLLVSGWIIALTALQLLHGNMPSVFVLAGIAVQIVGFVLVAMSHMRETEQRG